MLENKNYSLNELSKIKGSFQEGLEYLCTKSNNSAYLKGHVYLTNNKGIIDEHDQGRGRSYCTTGDTETLFKPLIKTEYQTTQVGLQFKFQHEFEEGYEHLNQDTLGWENGDLLEIIHKTTNHDKEDVFIVLNTQEDVLSTAVFHVGDFCLHKAPPTGEEKQMTKLMHLFPEGECITLRQAEIIVKAGWRK